MHEGYHAVNVFVPWETILLLVICIANLSWTMIANPYKCARARTNTWIGEKEA
jgi:hypothetical protein